MKRNLYKWMCGFLSAIILFAGMPASVMSLEEDSAVFAFSRSEGIMETNNNAPLHIASSAANQSYLFGLCEIPRITGGGASDAAVTPEVTADLAGAIGAKSYRLWMHLTSVLQRDGSNNISLNQGAAAQFKAYLAKLQGQGITHITAMSHYYLYPNGFAGNPMGNAIPEPGTAYYTEFLDMLADCYEILGKAFPEITYWEPGNETVFDRFIAKSGYRAENTKAQNVPYIYTNTEKAQITADISFYATQGLARAGFGQQTVLPGMVFDTTSAYKVNNFLEDIYQSIESGLFPRGSAAKSVVTDDYFRVLNWHPYRFSAMRNSWINANKNLYAVAQNHGDNGKKVFLTEIGIPDGVAAQIPYNAQNQITWTSDQYDAANWLLEQYEAIEAEMPWVETAHVFRMFDWKIEVDGSLSDDSDEKSFGLFTTPGNEEFGCLPKPVALALFAHFNGANADTAPLYQYSNVSITKKPSENSLDINSHMFLDFAVNGNASGFTWGSSNHAVATVDTVSGFLRGMSAGTAIITVSNGFLSDSFILTVIGAYTLVNCEDFENLSIAANKKSAQGNMNIRTESYNHDELSVTSDAAECPQNGSGYALKYTGSTTDSWGGVIFDLSGIVSGKSYVLSFDFRLLEQSGSFYGYANYGNVGINNRNFAPGVGNSYAYKETFTAGQASTIKIFMTADPGKVVFAIDNFKLVEADTVAIGNRPLDDSMQVGDTWQLMAQTGNAAPVWQSSNTNVATVVNGEITAIAPGIADITLSASGKSDFFTLTVTQASGFTEFIQFDDFTGTQSLDGKLTFGGQMKADNRPQNVPDGANGSYVHIKTSALWASQTFTFHGNFDKTATYKISFLLKSINSNSANENLYFKFLDYKLNPEPFVTTVDGTKRITFVFDPADYPLQTISEWDASALTLSFFSTQAVFEASVDCVLLEKMMPVNSEDFENLFEWKSNMYGKLRVSPGYSHSMSLTDLPLEIPENGSGTALKCNATAQYGGPTFYTGNLQIGQRYELYFEIKSLSGDTIFFVNYDSTGLESFSVSNGSSKTVVMEFTADTRQSFKIFPLGSAAVYTVDNFRIVPKGAIDFSSVHNRAENVLQTEAGMTLTHLKALLLNAQAQEITFKTSDGKELLKTGGQVHVLVDGVRHMTLTIVVEADVNGDGLVNGDDVELVRSHLLGKTLISGVAVLAADYYEEGGVTLNSLIYVRNTVG